MGLTLGVPLFFLIKSLVTNERGIVAGIKELWAKILLWRLRRNQKRRFDLYGYDDPNDLYRLTLKVPPLEWKTESKFAINGSESDNILFYGGNSGGERLVVRISRRENGRNTAWLLLKSKDDNFYDLHKEEVYTEPNTGKESFVAGGLRIKCLTPMRNWKITFNGLLRKNGKEVVHVKFAFSWIASSAPHDLKYELRGETFCKYLATYPLYKIDIERITKYLDSYVQVGYAIGQMQEGTNRETDVHLWGIKKRSLELCDDFSPTSWKEYFAYSKEGEFLHFGQIQYPDNPSNLLGYAFIIRQNGVGGVAKTYQLIEQEESTEITVERAIFKYTFCLSKIEKQIELKSGDARESRATLALGTFHIKDDEDDIGHYLFSHQIKGNKKQAVSKHHIRNDESSSVISPVISLKEDVSQLVSVSGGKGASLAKLIQLSKNKEMNFHVPDGFVVTTKAYEEFASHKDMKLILKSLESIAWTEKPINLEEACEMAVSAVENIPLPKILQNEIENKLKDAYREKVQDVKFAIRSSASGEDSEELSAAGQMNTYLGIRGMENVQKAVVKCWASQFTFVSVQYKRQNGQLLNSPMAVVIQEMVSAEAAGVMFTCDPVTGNPSNITITGNYGLGESVVSGAVEPDTLTFQRNQEGLTGKCDIHVGKKDNQIVLKDDLDGVRETNTDEIAAQKCCISMTDAKELAALGIYIEDSYGCPVDIEWATKSDSIYLLQARPVTTFDRESDFEINNQFNTPIRSEEEYSSTANIGEVMPGAFSNLGANALNKVFEIPLHLRNNAKIAKVLFPVNSYYQRGAVKVQNISMFALCDVLLRSYTGEKNLMAEAMMVATFGRILDDEILLSKAAKRNKLNKPVPGWSQTRYLLSAMFGCGKKTKELKSRCWSIRIDLSDCNNSQDAHDQIWKRFIPFSEPFGNHCGCSFSSAIYNLTLLSVLVNENEGWTSEVYSDFAYILATCNDVESADVPRSMDVVISEIYKCPDASKFKEASPEDALSWLQNPDNPASHSFKLFLENHGHRCYKELDILSTPWSKDPISLIKVLQGMMRPGAKGNVKASKPVGLSETFSNMKTKLNWKNRLLFRIVLPLCRNAVGLRERSKSLVVKMLDHLRLAYLQLGEIMVREGRLPSQGLIFYLNTYELDYLIETRSPKLVQKAIRRKQLHPSLNYLIYPEIGRGIPKPINYGNTEASEKRSTDLLLKGVPVSAGLARGPARVATSLKEAANIQPGEILIAYSTDIGWTPYFPMLAGVVTEIGGLVSHGAVVAREYGLPCVVAVRGATQHFKSGDLVILDGSKGTLERIK